MAEIIKFVYVIIIFLSVFVLFQQVFFYFPYNIFIGVPLNDLWWSWDVVLDGLSFLLYNAFAL